MTIEQRKLPVKLTDSERTEKARQVARLTRKYAKIEEEKREAVKALGTELKETRKAMDQLAAAFETGVEERLVECRVEVRGMHREVIRVDTGEVVESRPLAGDEIEHLDATDGGPARTARVGRKKTPEADLN